MIEILSDGSFAPQLRTYTTKDENKPDYPILKMGKCSHFWELQIENFLPCNILIGNYCAISWNQQLFKNLDQLHSQRNISTYQSFSQNRQIIIANDVWIGQRATILGGVTVGSGAVIGTKAVVTQDVPPYAIVAGNPAKIIKYRFDEDTINKLNQIKWWYWPEEKFNANKDWITGKNGDIKAFADTFYQNSQPDFSADPIATDIKTLRRDGFKIFYFVLDDEETYPIWFNVLNNYLSAFTENDKVVLLLELDTNNKPLLKSIQKELLKKPTAANVVNFTKTNTINLNVLSSVDYFVTNCDFNSLIYADYAYDYNVKVLSGLDNSIFIK